MSSRALVLPTLTSARHLMTQTRKSDFFYRVFGRENNVACVNLRLRAASAERVSSRVRLQAVCVRAHADRDRAIHEPRHNLVAGLYAS